MKENTHHFLKVNTLFALFMGLSFIAASYTFYKTGWGVITNPQLNNLIFMLTIAGCFIGVRKYREEEANGILSYAGALGTCMYLIAVSAVIHAIYIFNLYSHSPELLTDFVRMTQDSLTEFYKSSPLKEEILKLAEGFTTPLVIAMADIFNKIFTGLIFSLFLAGILYKKADVRPI